MSNSKLPLHVSYTFFIQLLLTLHAYFKLEGILPHRIYVFFIFSCHFSRKLKKTRKIKYSMFTGIKVILNHQKK